MGMAAAKDVVGGVSAPGYDEAPDLPLAEAALQVRMTREQPEATFSGRAGTCRTWRSPLYPRG